MANSSIHIAPAPVKGGGTFGHNSREIQTKNSIFSDEDNFCSCNKKTAMKFLNEEIETSVWDTCLRRKSGPVASQ